jgi:molybdate transport system ATP-binding protein
LAGHAHRRPRELSGGEQQRVALARALATEPRLLLLDEPLAALDATTRVETRRELRRQLSSFGGARLLITHEPVDALALADRLVIVEAGRIVQVGAPEEVTARPRSRYVADLVGLNLVRGTGHDGAITTTGGHLAVAGAHRGEVFAVIHPRAITLHGHRPDGSARNAWEGVVDDLDPRGDVVRVHVRSEAGQPPLVAEITRAAAAELAVVPGARVWIALKATEIDVYPA